MSLAGPSLRQPVSSYSLLSQGRSTNPDELALVSAESRMRWREPDEFSTRLATQHLALDLEPGDRMALKQLAEERVTASTIERSD